MKKIISLFSLVLVLGISVLGVNAETSKLELEELYTFDKFEDGSLGYNKEKPVYYYGGSSEQVKIPKNFEQPKRQMKSGWVATIFNINIPTPKSEEDFKELYMERLNDFVDWNMNAMIFQIRPLLDAYYPSEINPTSEYLSGKQGVDVDYDPLEWMIEETHKAGLEYHAWLNPYRVTNSPAESLLPKGTLTTDQMNEMLIEDYINLLVEHGVLSKDNFAVKNPEYVIRFGGKLILNPGHPEVRQHVVDTVDELITNYDLDAIHFDDYFYPYGTDNKKDKKEEEVKEEVTEETQENESTQEETKEKSEEKENLVEEKTKEEVNGVSEEKQDETEDIKEENQDLNEIESEDSKNVEEEANNQDNKDEQEEVLDPEINEEKEDEIEKEDEKEEEKPVEDFDLQDRAEFEKYGIPNGYEDTEEGLEQWRRDNVTSLIKDLNKTIRDHNKKNKKAVQLGISPFGIWEHKGNHPDGSNTPLNSTSTYSKSIFADTKAWIDQELIDYIAPQIYWSFDTSAAPYGELARWWNNVVEGKNVKLYVGHPNYKYIEGWAPGASFLNPEEINNQVKFNQLYPNISGSILFSYRNMKPDNLDEIKDELKPKHDAMNKSIEVLKNDTFSKPALTPALPWLSTGDVKAVENIEIKDSNLIIDDQMNDNARFYMIYRGTSNQSDEEIIRDINNLDGKILSKGKAVYTHPIEKLNSGDKFVVTVVDRASVETEGISVTHLVKEEPVVDDKPSEDIKENTGESNSELPATGMSPIILTTGIASAGLGSIAVILSKRKRK